jgi:hypothetical protein
LSALQASSAPKWCPCNGCPATGVMVRTKLLAEPRYGPPLP